MVQNAFLDGGVSYKNPVQSNIGISERFFINSVDSLSPDKFGIVISVIIKSNP